MDLSKQFTSSLTHVKRLGNTPFVSEDIVQINEEKSEYVESINFQTDKYAVAKSGGGIVVAHACNQDDDGYYKKLVVYNSFLKKICDIPLKYDKKLTKLFFTQEECVIAVFGDGTLVSFNLRGHVIKENKLFIQLFNNTKQINPTTVLISTKYHLSVFAKLTFFSSK